MRSSCVRKERVKLVCGIVHETDNAILVCVAGVEYWLPLSTVHSLHRNEGYIMVDAWILERKGIIV